MTFKGKPSGPFSIGRALEIPPGSVNDDLRLAVEAIDRVHGVGLLPRIPVTVAGHFGAPGRFSYNPVTGEPIRIVVSGTAPHQTFVALHEIGHFLDLAAFGKGPAFGSTINPMMADAISVVRRSSAYLELEVRSVATNDDHRLVRLQPDELWARSYAQYVVVRSGISKLLDVLETRRSILPGDLHNPLYWEDNDFEDIAKAIDELFFGIGWRK